MLMASSLPELHPPLLLAVICLCPGNANCDHSVFLAPGSNKIFQKTRCLVIQRVDWLTAAQEDCHLRLKMIAKVCQCTEAALLCGCLHIWTKSLQKTHHLLEEIG